MIKCKSVFDKPVRADGRRILVDLFWPQSIKTRYAQVHEWLQELGPSYDLQRFHFNAQNWDTYKSMYMDEILSNEDKRERLAALARDSSNGDVTLLYGNPDPEHNHAVVIKEMIEKKLFEKNKAEEG